MILPCYAPSGANESTILASAENKQDEKQNPGSKTERYSLLQRDDVGYGDLYELYDAPSADSLYCTTDNQPCHSLSRSTQR